MNSVDVSANTGFQSPRVSPRRLDQWLCLWTYPVSMGFLTLALFLMGPLLPPIPPSAPAAEAVARFSGGKVVAWAVVILIVTQGMQLALQGLVIHHMTRMTPGGKFLGLVYLLSYASAMLPAGLLLSTSWGVAVLQTEDYHPDIIQALADMGYLAMIAIVSGFLVQFLCLSVAIFLDRGRIMPLWFGYVGIWATCSELLFLPAYLTKVGPFAYNGLLDFWLGIFIYGIWVMGLFIALAKAIRSDDRASESEPEAAQGSGARSDGHMESGHHASSIHPRTA